MPYNLLSLLYCRIINFHNVSDLVWSIKITYHLFSDIVPVSVLRTKPCLILALHKAMKEFILPSHLSTSDYCIFKVSPSISKLCSIMHSQKYRKPRFVLAIVWNFYYRLCEIVRSAIGHDTRTEMSHGHIARVEEPAKRNIVTNQQIVLDMCHLQSNLSRTWHYIVNFQLWRDLCLLYLYLLSELS